MISFLALLVFLVLLEALIITLILSVYTTIGYREAWSLTWTQPWILAAFTIGNLLAAW